MASSILGSATDPAPPRIARRGRAIWRFVRRDPVAAVAACALLAIIVMALAAGRLTPYAYDKQDLDAVLRLSSGAHPFGTDTFGRDVLSRVAFGAQISLSVALIAVAAEIVVGTLWGTFAGLTGGPADAVMMSTR